MDKKLKPYLLAVLLSNLYDRQTQVNRNYLSLDDTLGQISALLDGKVPSKEMMWAFNLLVEMGLFSKISDELAGEFFRMDVSPAVVEVTRELQDEDSLIYKYRTVGPKFLDSVIERIGQPAPNQTERASLDSPSTVPASDRLVKLNHNQISSFDDQVSELVEELESKDNGDPEYPGLRERILGQIKAGRELIRAGEFRAYLLYEVLVRALGELIEKYGNPSVKAMANALLGAIVSQILEG